MAKLAIKGHDTRGKEVIELLEMMGGRNPIKFFGDTDDYLYFGNGNGNIAALDIDSARLSEFAIFTLEKFLEKYPFKVGDEVMIARNGVPYVAEVKAMKWSENINEVLYQVGYIHNVKAMDIHVEQSKEKNIEENKWVKEWALPDGYEFQDENGNAINEP